MTSVTLPVTLSENMGNEFTDDERQVYLMIKDDTKVTREKLAESIGKSTRTVQRIIERLSNKGYLTRIGSNRFGYWEILK